MSEPIRIIISGVTGRMGRRLLTSISQHDNMQVVAGVASEQSPHLHKTVSELMDEDFGDAKIVSGFEDLKADIVIDFSQPEAFNDVIDYCVMSETPLVSGTTGLSQAQFDRISQAGHFIAVLWAANFSINIQIIKNLLQIFKQKNQIGEYSITETHHQHKKDAPSGTAISLAMSITDNQQLKVMSKQSFTLGSVRIDSVRQGEVPGTHQIICDFPHETITVTHVAKSGDLFADGAVDAASWLIKQHKGLYDLNAIILA